ncbi:ABC transporter permease [Enterovirga sp.]|uniref:ABC transporter permease n=1 Tax=Enterovirga sp. TaxID=2026350 RepID=UPI002B89AA80|nr:ABC transporter permease [Enterovirga sp.]HMO28141.1 ABC transporter permease [Enterovirga sp.]
MSLARTASYVVGSLTLAFLVAPLAAVVPASFNRASFIQLPPAAYSMRWYEAFFSDPEWLSSFWVSVRVAILATACSLAIGTLAALGLERAPPRLRATILALVLSPLIVPVIMTSIALYYVARPLGLHGTVPGLALGHTVLALPFVVVNVGLALRAVDPNCARAAASLGASPWRIFRTVTLPLIAPGLAGAAAFAFITSFDEAVLSIFLSGIGAKPLPVKLWEIIRVEFTPVSAVASSVLIAMTIVLFAAVQVARARQPGGREHAG